VGSCVAGVRLGGFFNLKNVGRAVDRPDDGLHRVLLNRECQPPGQSADVGVHGKTGEAEGDATYDVASSHELAPSLRVFARAPGA